MTWHFTPFSIPLLIGAGVLVISAFFILRRPTTLVNNYMAIVNLLIAIFSGAYGLELAQTSLDGIHFWRKVGYLGGATSPVFLLLLILAYNGAERWLNGVNHLVLLTLPFISIGFAWTNQHHSLLWTNPRLVQSGTLYLFDYNPGGWYWVAMIYAYSMAFLSVMFLAFSFFRRKGAFRKQVLLFMVGIFFPLLVFGFYSISIAMGLSLPKIEWHAYALIITGLIVTGSLQNTQVFQIGPVAYDAIFRNIEDMIVVLDDQNRVIDINPIAARVFNWERLAVIGKNLLTLLSSIELEALEPYLKTSEAHGEIVIGDYHLDLKITPFQYQLRRSVGRLMVMRDITHRVAAEDAMRELAALNERRRLASDLHDSTTQSLHSLILSAEAVHHLHQENQAEKLNTTLTILEDSARQALKEMRLLLYELNVTPEEEIDLLNFLEARLGVVERRMGIDTELSIDDLGVIPEDKEREIFFIIIEALNNTLKHSRADFVSVDIQGSPYQLSVTVVDNGVGFFPGQIKPGGMGLQNIRERAARLGGDLVIDSAPGKGTTIRMVMDFGPTPEKASSKEDHGT